MPVTNIPDSLYVQCMDMCIPMMERAADTMVTQWSPIIDSLGGSIARDLLSRAFYLANKENSSNCTKWKDAWIVFYTNKITSAIFSWNENLIDHVRNQCKNLKQIQVVDVVDFDAGLVMKCPPAVITIDFDGELTNRGSPPIIPHSAPANWLSHSDKLLRSVLLSKGKVSDYSVSGGMPALCELHLGNVAAAPKDLAQIIKKCGNLRILKHYQLVSALYLLHADQWRNKRLLPVYKLKNLDADFSHVIRCRMSPEWVLAPDALQLAVKLCPRANRIRVRFDCSTPNHVLSPLVELASVRELSAVCVTSGERSLLDFTDIIPILEKHGPENLTYLELKVIEEVEIHVIIEKCFKLESLILSGCGYVTPYTCSNYNCHSYKNGSLNRLRILFYADGDDFSWDHGVPKCFWKATLLPAGVNEIVRLEGIFLEYPRIPVELTSAIFSPKMGRLPFPNLMVFSLCRYHEIGIEHVASVCGLSKTRENKPCSSLSYIRLSKCEKMDEKAGKIIKKWASHESGLRNLLLHVDYCDI